MTNRIDAARVLASDIDRLAYMVDPYEYFDVVGREESEQAASREQIQADLLAGNCQPYIEWLAGIATDENNDRRDRERAAGRLARVLEFLN